MAEKSWYKKRLWRSSVLIISVLLAGVIIAGSLVWRDHLGNRAEAEQLAAQIALVNQEITVVPLPPENLDAKLSEAKADLAAAEEAVPAVIHRNDVVDYILDLAEECRVEAVPLIVEGWVPEGDYNALKLKVTVTGRLDGVTALIAALQDSEYRSLTIGGITVNCLDQSSAGFGDDTIVAADMDIALYTCPSLAQEDKAS